jgi:hypothetical protein
MDFPWLDLLIFAPLLGHVLYGIPLRRSEAARCEVALYNGDDFTDSDEPPNPERLSSVRGISAQSDETLIVRGTKAEGVRVDASALPSRPAYVIVETPPTLIRLEASKFESYLSHEGLVHVIEERRRRGESDRSGHEIYSKHIKVALADDNGALGLLGGTTGLPIEFVPLSPLPNLRVRLLAEGQPLAQAQVRVSYREDDTAAPEPDRLLQTDPQGEASIHVARPGLWRLHAISMQRLHADGEAEWKSIWTSLTFRVEA